MLKTEIKKELNGEILNVLGLKDSGNSIQNPIRNQETKAGGSKVPSQSSN